MYNNYGFRKPATRNEVRALETAAYYGVPVRAKRNAANLPNAWDDKPVKGNPNRKRGPQYKVVDI